MSDRDPSQPDWMITPAQLSAALGKVVLVDVRDPEEHQEGRISGCMLLPLDEIHHRAENELTKDSDIVLYCAHGVRSLEALMALRMKGFQNLRSLSGGICAWEEQGLPIERE